MGVGLHYLADPENAALATTRSMELPILRRCQAYQALWVEIYRCLFKFVLEHAGKDPLAVQYELPVPRMVEPDIQGVSNAIATLYDRHLLTPEQAGARGLELLGFDDVGREIEALRSHLVELQATLAAMPGQSPNSEASPSDEETPGTPGQADTDQSDQAPGQAAKSPGYTATRRGRRAD